MSDAEKIAREITDTWVRAAIGPVTARNLADVIATVLREAEARGYAAAREQAAGVAERQAREWGVYRDHWPQRDACGDVAEAIRQMKPNTAPSAPVKPIASPPDIDSDEEAFS